MQASARGVLFAVRTDASPASLFPFLHFGEGGCFSWLMNTDYDPFCLAWTGAREVLRGEASVLQELTVV